MQNKTNVNVLWECRKHNTLSGWPGGEYWGEMLKEGFPGEETFGLGFKALVGVCKAKM